MRLSDLRNAHQITIWVAAVAVLVAASLSACSGKQYGPYSPPEMAAKLHELDRTVPVYAPPQSSSLVPVFRYTELTSEAWLVSYFGSKGPNGQVERVAKLRTSLVEAPLEGAFENSRTVKVAWAEDSTGKTCIPLAGIFDYDEFLGNAYHTCLAWYSEGYNFLLYSTLPVDETVSLANSLEQVQ